MTVFGDLDMSTLTELPAGRAAIATHVVPVAERPHYLARTWQRIREEVAAGRQAYVVCPRIGDDAGPGQQAGPADRPAGSRELAEERTGYLPDEESGEPADGGPARPPLAVLDLAAQLAAAELAGLRIGILHGRLAPDGLRRPWAAILARASSNFARNWRPSIC